MDSLATPRPQTQDRPSPSRRRPLKKPDLLLAVFLAVLAGLVFNACDLFPSDKNECSDSGSLLPSASSSCEPSPYYPWSQQPPTDYSFTYTRQCFCLQESIGPFYVTMSSGLVTEVLRRTEAGDTVEVSGDLQSYALDSIWAGVNKKLSQSYAHAFVRHDSTWGFPDSFYVDPVSGMADDENGVTITEFHPYGGPQYPNP